MEICAIFVSVIVLVRRDLLVGGADTFCVGKSNNFQEILTSDITINPEEITISPAPYTCDFKPEESCTNPFRSGWKLNSSLASDETFILDRRWESFPTKSKVELKHFNNNRLIPFSIRGSSKIIVTMCAEGLNSCEEFHILLHNVDNNWKHYWISIDDSFLRIRDYRNDDSEKISFNLNNYAKYNVNDFNKYYRMNDMTIDKMNLKRLSLFKDELYIKKLEVNKGLLKLHDYRYVYTKNQISEKLSLTVPIHCLALTVTMCTTCKLKIDVFGTTYQAEIDSKKWEEFKFTRNNTKIASKSLAIETLGGNEHRFWAIGQIRSCNKLEKRLLKLDKNLATCVETDWNSRISFEAEIYRYKFGQRNTLNKIFFVGENSTTAKETTAVVTTFPSSNTDEITIGLSSTEIRPVDTSSIHISADLPKINILIDSITPGLYNTNTTTFGIVTIETETENQSTPIESKPFPSLISTQPPIVQNSTRIITKPINRNGFEKIIYLSIITALVIIIFFLVMIIVLRRTNSRKEIIKRTKPTLNNYVIETSGFQKYCEDLFDTNKIENLYQDLEYPQNRHHSLFIDENYEKIMDYHPGYNNEQAYLIGVLVAKNQLFWETIWKENVSTMVVLGEFKELSYKLHETVHIKNLHFQMSSEVHQHKMIMRSFNLLDGQRSRQVHNIHLKDQFTNGLPDDLYSLLPLLRVLVEIEKFPIVIFHNLSSEVSARVIAIFHSCYLKLKNENVIDINTFFMNHALGLSEYKLLHILLYDLLYAPSPNDEDYLQKLPEYLFTNTWVNKEYERLILNYKHRRELENLNVDYNRLKRESSRAKIKNFERQPLLAHSFQERKSSVEKFFTIKQPTINTLWSFWEFVLDRNICVIVSLNEISQRFKGKFWPDEETICIKPKEHIIVTHDQTTRKELYNEVVVSVTIILGQIPKIRKIVLYQLNNWQSTSGVPDNPDVFKEFLEITQRTKKNILVTCLDGETACRLFIVLMEILTKVYDLSGVDLLTLARFYRLTLSNSEEMMRDQLRLISDFITPKSTGEYNVLEFR